MHGTEMEVGYFADRVDVLVENGGSPGGPGGQAPRGPLCSIPAVAEPGRTKINVVL